MNRFSPIAFALMCVAGLALSCALKRQQGPAVAYEVLLQDSCADVHWIERFNSSGALSNFQRTSKSEHRWSFAMQLSKRKQQRMIDKMEKDPCVLYVHALPQDAQPATNSTNQGHVKSKPIRNQ